MCLGCCRYVTINCTVSYTFCFLQYMDVQNVHLQQLLKTFGQYYRLREKERERERTS